MRTPPASTTSTRRCARTRSRGWGRSACRSRSRGPSTTGWWRACATRRRTCARWSCPVPGTCRCGTTRSGSQSCCSARSVRAHGDTACGAGAHDQRRAARARGRHAGHVARRAARAARPHRRQEGLRPRPVRRLHGNRRRPPRERVPAVRDRRARRRDDDRGARRRRGPAPAPGGVRRARRVPVRLLHARPDLLRRGHDRGGARGLAERRDGGRAPGPGARRRRDPRAHERQPVPLRRLREHRPGDRGGGAMRPFGYERAADAAGAVALLEGAPEGARYLAGGTNLVDLMKLEVETPALLVDVCDLGTEIEETAGGGLRIGAGVTNSALAADRRVRERYPLLAQSVLAGASGQLRNVATAGGNLLQRTRCAYFQDVTKPCNKRQPGAGCPAREGDHRNLAVLGHSAACVATNPSDMAVALAALGATVHVTGPRGERSIPIPGLHRLPGDEPQRDPVLEPGELIVALELAPPVMAERSRYRKVRDRASYAFAVVSVAVAVELDRGTVRDCRIAFGGPTHVPWRAGPAEDALLGATAGEAAFRAAADAELAAAEPLRDNAFKVPLARNLLVSTLA